MDEMLNVTDCVKILKMNRLTVLKHIREKKLKASKLGKVYRIRKSDLDKFIESNVVK